MKILDVHVHISYCGEQFTANVTSEVLLTVMNPFDMFFQTYLGEKFGITAKIAFQILGTQKLHLGNF